MYPSKSNNAHLNQIACFPNFCTAAIFSGNRDTDPKNDPAQTHLTLNEGVGGAGTGAKDGHWTFGTVDAIHPNANPSFSPPDMYVFEPEWTTNSAMWLANNAIDPTAYPLVTSGSSLYTHFNSTERRNVLWDAQNLITVATTHGGSTGTLPWRSGEHDYGYGGLDNYGWDANVSCAPFTTAQFQTDLTQYIDNAYGSGGPCQGHHCITIEVKDQNGTPVPSYPITMNMDSAGNVSMGVTGVTGILQYSIGPGAIPTTTCIINSCMDIFDSSAAHGGSAPSGGTMGDCKQTRIQITLSRETFVVGANITVPCCPDIGCIDPLACNYDAAACYPCDASGSGVSSVPGSLGECCIYTAGCTDPNAINYDILNTHDCACNLIGSGAYTAAGTPQSGQTNYGDTSCCLYSGCLDPLAAQYNTIEAVIGCSAPVSYTHLTLPTILRV